MSAPKAPSYERRVEMLADDLHRFARAELTATHRAKIAGVPAVVLTAAFIVCMVANIPMLAVTMVNIATMLAWWTVIWFLDDRSQARRTIRGILIATPYLVGNPLSEKAARAILAKHGVEYVSVWQQH